MKNILFIFLGIVTPYLIFGQGKFNNHVKSIEGVWIESEFQTYFDTTLSMLELSKRKYIIRKKHLPIMPIGLRINSAEIKNNSINIGYGILHSHNFFPEVSNYCIQQNDTVYEQGSFNINLDQIDSLGSYEIPDLYYMYNISPTCYLRINYALDTTITITREPTDQIPEIIISFQRIQSKFSPDYPYPNPRDLYIRGKTLVGDYTLKDRNDMVLSNNLEIHSNGIINGYSEWENKKIDFNTDVFCGGQTEFDKVLIYDSNKISDSKSKLFIYNAIEDKTIQLLDIRTINNNSEVHQVKYTLTKNY